MKGFEPLNPSQDSGLRSHSVSVSIQSTSASRSTIVSYSLLSAANREFDFGSKDDGTYANIDLLRFAELDPRIVLASHNRNETLPLDIHISAKVVNLLALQQNAELEEEQE